MDQFQAVVICEGVEEANEETQVEAWQFLIDNDSVWQLQGWFGRQAVALIEAGVCHEARKPGKEIGS